MQLGQRKRADTRSDRPGRHVNRNATWPAEQGGHQQRHKGQTRLKKELRTPNSKLFGEKRFLGTPPKSKSMIFVGVDITHRSATREDKRRAGQEKTRGGQDPATESRGRPVSQDRTPTVNCVWKSCDGGVFSCDQSLDLHVSACTILYGLHV